MRRRVFFLGCPAAMLPWARRTSAQSGTPIPLGYVWIGVPGSDGPTLSGIRRGLAEVGLVEGRDVVIDARYAEGQPDRLRGHIEELVARKVALLLVPGSVATAAARAVTTRVPIVSASGDPVGSGFALSLSRPGGNVTGMAIVAGDQLAGKWVDLLRETAPATSRAVLLVNPANLVTPTIAEVARRAGAASGMDIVPVPLAATAGLAPALAAIVDAKAGAMVVSDDPLLVSLRRAIVAFAAERRLPAVYGHRQYAAAGGLISYSADVSDVWRHAGGYIQKILKGANPADLPIEQPTKFELVINRKTADALGITLPLSVLARADEVIE